MNKDCAIARDLMPAVIDHVASAESQAFVDGHVAGCEPCAQVYADMQNDLQTAESAAPQAAETSFKEAVAQLRKTLGWKRLKTALLAVLVTLVLLFAGSAAYYFLFMDSSARSLPMDAYTVALYQGSDGAVYGTTTFHKNYQSMNGAYTTLGDDDHTLYVTWKAPVFPAEVELRVFPHPQYGFKLQRTADGDLSFRDGTVILEVRQGTPDDYITVYHAGDAITPLDPAVEEYFRLENQLTDGVYAAQQMHEDAKQALEDAQSTYYDAVDQLESGETAAPAAAPIE